MTNALAQLLGKRPRKVRHSKLTAEQWARLDQQAELLAKLVPQKVLARELNISLSYVAQSLSRLVQEKRGDVPRVAHVYALDSSRGSGTIGE